MTSHAFASRDDQLFTREGTIDILLALAERGPMRFTALQAELPTVPARMLAARLSALRNLGFVARPSAIAPGAPECALTVKGRRLAAHLAPARAAERAEHGENDAPEPSA